MSDKEEIPPSPPSQTAPGNNDHRISVGSKKTASKIIACFCCQYSDTSRVYGSGAFIPRLADSSDGLAVGRDGDEAWETRFDKAVSELANIAASYKTGAPIRYDSAQ